MARTVTLLTLDTGSVLYNPDQMPDEVVLKHTDGELIKTKRSDDGKWQSLRREELDVNFWKDSEYSSPVEAVATLADRQAFGFRKDGEPVNPLTVRDGADTDTIEVEGLDRGGIVFETERQLPFAVYTTEEIYYRGYVTKKQIEEDGPEQPTAVLDKRKGPTGEWEETSLAPPTEAGSLLETIADETDMKVLTQGAEEMEKEIGDQQELFEASRTAEDDELRQEAAIQNRTAFSPATPRPRPVEFPE